MESNAVKTPFWLWPNLLSLDAPIVAVLWQILFARCFRIQISPWTTLVLAATVWLIYSADRVLDAKRGVAHSHRHRFYHRHWRSIVALWTLVIPTTAWLTLEHLPHVLFERGLLLLALVGVYLVAVHVFDQSVFERLLFKEISVGLLFALGVSVTAWNGVHNLADAATILLFAALCAVNCVAIEVWETHQRYLSINRFGIAITGLAFLLLFAHRPILGGAEIVSTAALLILNRSRVKFSLNALRVLADVALLSPVVFLPLAS